MTVSVRFLAIFITLAALGAMMRPPLFTGDPLHHFYRANQISHGDLVADGGGGLVDDDIRALGSFAATAYLGDIRLDPRSYWAALQAPSPSAVKSGREIFPSAAYPPLTYAPQAVGLAAGRMLGLGALRSHLLSIALSGITYLALCLIAVTHIPRAKWSVLAIALAPLPLAQGFSVSADGMTIGVCLLFVALVLRAAALERPLSGIELFWIGVAGLALPLVKPGYASLLALLLAIRSDQVGGRLRQLSLLGIAIAVPLTVTVLWMRANDALQFAAHYGYRVSPGEQMSLLAASPLRIPLVVVETLAAGFPWSSMIGAMAIFESRTYWIELPPLLSVLYLAGVVVLALVEPRVAIPNRIRVCSATAGTLLVSIALLCLLFYIATTEVGARHAFGLQGRYLLPLIPLLLVLVTFVGDRTNAPHPRSAAWLFTSLAVMSLVGQGIAVERAWHDDRRGSPAVPTLVAVPETQATIRRAMGDFDAASFIQGFPSLVTAHGWLAHEQRLTDPALGLVIRLTGPQAVYEAPLTPSTREDVGRLLSDERFASMGATAAVDVSSLKAGSYLLQLRLTVGDEIFVTQERTVRIKMAPLDISAGS